MSAIDILILVVVGVGAVMGFTRGIIGQVGQIAGVIGGIIASRLFGSRLAAFFAGQDAPSAFDNVAGYVVVFLLAYLGIWLVARLVRGTVHAVHLGIVDRVAGAIFKGALWLLMLSMVLNFYIIVSGDVADLHNAKAPWREATVRFAPAVLGYIGHAANKEYNDSVK